MSTRCAKLGPCLALLVFAISACGTRSTEITKSSTPPHLNATLTSTMPASAAPLPTISLDSIEQIVSDPAYLSGCSISPTNVPPEQVSFRSVIPGVSSDADVKNLLGDPNEKPYGANQWLYDGVSIFFDEQTGVAEDISIFSGTTFDQMALPLRDIIGRYGCPELIYAYDGGEEKRGHFDVTTLAYPRMGIEFEILGTPVSLESRPREVSIFAAESLSEYLLAWKWMFEDPQTSVVLPWDEAVTK